MIEWLSVFMVDRKAWGRTRGSSLGSLEPPFLGKLATSKFSDRQIIIIRTGVVSYLFSSPVSVSSFLFLYQILMNVHPPGLTFVPKAAKTPQALTLAAAGQDMPSTVMDTTALVRMADI